MNAIQSFAIELWNDLRARRLVPVAVVLVAGLIAAPILLSKKADDSPAPAPEPAASQNESKDRPGPDELAQVKLEDALGKGNGSSLSAFDVNDPFAPPEKVLKAAQAATQSDTGLPGADTGAGGITVPDTGTPTGTGGEGTGGGGETPDNGTGGQGGTTTEFTYVLDVTFWANGHRRKIEGMDKLDILPNQAAPLLIFMGVTDSAGNAVFLVDSTLSAAGEGKCKPSHAECAFVYIGAGSEEEFTNDDGDSYRLRIDEIRKVKVGGDSGTAASDSKKKTSKSARAAVGAPTPARRFVPPVLTDLVIESGGGSENSTGADERR
jgi:hypothetical protein